MSIAQFSLAGASIASAVPTDGATKKTPPRRTALAVADIKLVPEPR